MSANESSDIPTEYAFKSPRFPMPMLMLSDLVHLECDPGIHRIKKKSLEIQRQMVQFKKQ